MKLKGREADAMYLPDLQAKGSIWLYIKVLGEINMGI